MRALRLCCFHGIVGIQTLQRAPTALVDSCKECPFSDVTNYGRDCLVDKKEKGEERVEEKGKKTKDRSVSNSLILLMMLIAIIVDLKSTHRKKKKMKDRSVSNTVDDVDSNNQ